MTSTYTANNGIEKIETGDQSGTWGETTNTNFDIIDRALNGVGSITLSGTSHTLTTTDGSLTDGMFKVLSLAGSPTGTNTITISPNDQDKLYFVKNASGQSAVFSQGTGANVTIPDGNADIIFADGAGSGAAVSSLFASSVNFGDNVTLNSDDAVLGFGADTDVTITHDPDDGLFFKSAATGDDNPFVLTLQTGETDIAADDKLGVINFQAPDEGTGTDAILVAAGIEAVSEADFAADSNATSLVFKTASSEAAAEKVRITSSGLVNIGANSATSVTGMALKVEATGNVQQLLKAGTNFNSTIDFGDQDANDTGEIKYAHNGDFMAFKTNGAEAVKIDSSKRVQIGNVDASATTSAKNDAILTIVDTGSANPMARIAFDSGDSDVSNGVKIGYTAATFAPDFEISNGDAGIIRFSTSDTERVRITSAGLVGIGTTGPSTLLNIQGSDPTFLIQDSDEAGNGFIKFHTASGTQRAFIQAAMTSNVMLFGTGSTEAMRIDISRRLLIRKTTAGLTSPGIETHSADNGFLGTTSTGAALHVNRQDSDGTLVTFRHDNTSEGSITVSGSTVSYNGGHLSRWSQASDGNRIDGLVKGTVMTNLDKMAVWTSEDGKTKNNEQLNCMAVSSVEGDANVAGVFVNFNEDHDLDDPYAKSCVNDMNIAMTGDMVIRIASGTTIARGDLLMSAGDGTAKPQGDDIVRSKTIAKVTSTNVSHTYSDGSYLVPCVLMAC